MTLAMVSLAGIPPLAGFLWKISAAESRDCSAQATANHGYYCLAFTALVGRGDFALLLFRRDPRDLLEQGTRRICRPSHLSGPVKFSVCVCIAGMFWLGLFPSVMLNLATEAAKALTL